VSPDENARAIAAAFCQACEALKRFAQETERLMALLRDARPSRETPCRPN
jgi:hypothetical protein